MSDPLAGRLAEIAAELAALATRREPGRASHRWLSRAALDVQFALADVRHEDGPGPAPKLIQAGVWNGRRVFVEAEG
jgi:hypothetical protein